MSKKIDKPLFRLTKKNRKRHELAKSGMKDRGITIDPTENEYKGIL